MTKEQALTQAKHTLESVAKWLGKEGIPYSLSVPDMADLLANPDTCMLLQVKHLPGVVEKCGKFHMGFQLIWSGKHEQLQHGAIYGHGIPLIGHSHDFYKTMMVFENAPSIIYQINRFLHAPRIMRDEAREAIAKIRNMAETNG